MKTKLETIHALWITSTGIIVQASNAQEIATVRYENKLTIMPSAVPSVSHSILNSSLYIGRASDAKDHLMEQGPRHCKKSVTAYFKQVWIYS